MPRIYESRCGDAYGMSERLLDTSGMRSERAMKLGSFVIKRMVYTHSSQIHCGVLQVKKSPLRNRSYSPSIP